MTPKRPVVYIVDNDPAVRESIEKVVTSAGLLPQTFSSAQEFLKYKLEDHPGCVVLDLSLDCALNGLAVQRELMRAQVRLPVIFISAHTDIPTTVQAMKAGASDFLLKPLRDQEILGAIQEAVERDGKVRRESSETKELARRFRLLTRRERQVMQLVTSGLLNKEIAAQLGTSVVTVKVQRAQAMHKMQAKSLPELVRMGEKLGASK